ncbi:MAG: hypothetical protein JO214_05605 [Frankiaceae bacterium]|nr:hypothetical protein [Frankiaceae bacterium]
MDLARFHSVRTNRRMAITGLMVVAAVAPVLGAPAASADGALCAVRPDTVPPSVDSLTFDTSPIDVTAGPATIPVSMHVTDTTGNGTASGVKHAGLRFAIHHVWRSARLSLTSGDATDGTWSGEVTVPTWVRSGTLRLIDVHANDASRNYEFYYRGRSSPSGLALHPDWPKSIAVTSGVTKPPREHAGHLTDFTLSPSSVDTRHGAKQVQVSATFSEPVPTYVRLLVVGQRVKRHRWGHAMRLRSANPGDPFTGALTVPRWAGTEHATVRQLAVAFPPNVHPNFVSIGPRDLRKSHLPHRIRVTSRLDAVAPVLRSLVPSTTDLDTTAGPEALSFTAKMQDGGSGPRKLTLRMSRRGARRGSSLEVDLHRNGKRWTGSVTVPKCAASGRWAIYAETQDTARNYRFYRPSDLDAAGIESHLTIEAAPQVHGRPPTVRGATAAGAGHTITINFSRAVKNVTTESVQVYATEPASTRYDAPLSVTSITCDDGTVVVDCDGTAGDVRNAVLTVPDISAGQIYELWVNQGGVTPQLTDVAGYPADWQSTFATVTAA